MSNLNQFASFAHEVNELTEVEFVGFQEFIFKYAGVSLPSSKRALVAARVIDRVKALNLTSFSEYLTLLHTEKSFAEIQVAIDRLTTHETCFFREPAHYQRLREHIFPLHNDNDDFAIWSAACSTGEEAFSLGMECADYFGDTAWRVVGSDVSREVIQVAKQGLYPLERSEPIPRHFLDKYCLKGVRNRAGEFCIHPALQEHITFSTLNLHDPLSSMGTFDVIFLRKVLIYFSPKKREELLSRVIDVLRPNGFIFVGHTETLGTAGKSLRKIQQAVYQK